jgi:hypothetical protein
MRAKITKRANDNTLIISAVDKAFTANLQPGEMLNITRAIEDAKINARKLHWKFCGYLAGEFNRIRADHRERIADMERIYQSRVEAVSQYLRLSTGYIQRVMARGIVEIEIGKSLADKEIRNTPAREIFELIDLSFEFARNELTDYSVEPDKRLDLEPFYWEWDDAREAAGKERQYTRR